MLSSWGVKFDGFDVEAEPARKRDLEPFGIPRVPATIVGDRVVHGWNPKALAELVGARYEERTQLAPAELARRLDAVLVATQRAIRQVPREQLGMKAPGRDRTVRQLGFHVFRVSASFVDTREQGHLSEHWFEESPPVEMADGEAIAQHGETVRRRVAAYWSARPGTPPSTCARSTGSSIAWACRRSRLWPTPSSTGSPCRSKSGREPAVF
ncbi:MAG: hypothetical protein DME10_08810 [Candidatus Rokuibacteriota bacterium]|nr:MAG: hypothetical protein DME10_08810 [Candidatus Rokubacteria bacterium]